MNIELFSRQVRTPVQNVKYVKPDGQCLNLLVKRDDLIHPSISGNKWRKLKYNANVAQTGNFSGIASFGGAFSNHIAALSALGKLAEIPTIGFIRTDNLDMQNPTIKLAIKNNMRLVPLSRADYRRRHDLDFIASLQTQFPNHLFVPEGGSNDAAQLGVKELATEMEQQCQFDKYAVAIGSGGTVNGLLNALPHPAIGIAVVKDEQLHKQLQQQHKSKLTLHYNASLGRYGSVTPALELFCLDFHRQTGIPIEPIYTGKLFYNVCFNREFLGIKDQETILVIHTGGLQGINGLVYRQKISPIHWNAVIASSENQYSDLENL